MDYYKIPVKEVLSDLKTSENGLSDTEAKARLQRYGYNEIEEKEKISPLKIFLGQFSSPVVWILIGAVIVSLVIGEKIDAAVISIVLLLNSIIGFTQEYRAEKAILALKKMVSLKAIVIRDGIEKETDAKYLVPGDIIILKTGEKVPADARLIGIMNLQTQEAALTGESLPVQKELVVYGTDLGIADRKNTVYGGTIITNGRGRAVVTETGMRTEVGKIARLIQTTKEETTPLQKQMKHLGKWLGIITIVLCGIVFAAGIVENGAYDKKSILDFFILAVSLAVAAIPEGLPAVVTVALALGIKKMVKRNALIRQFPYVETLGTCTVICTDKTGTLTHNEMTVRKIYVDESVVDVSGSGYEPKGYFSQHTKTLPLLLKIGALNNDSALVQKDGRFEIIGDPTEGALIVSAAKLGLDKVLLENKSKRIDEMQFNAERKRMATVHELHGKRFCYVKGAPDVIIKLCSHIEINGQVRRMNANDAARAMKMNEYFAENALRVLGFAYKELGKDEKKEGYEKNLVFVGLQGMIDPPRKEAKDAIARCERAGIKVIIVTGDFKGTAVAIAREIGIKGRAVTGDELERMDLDKHVLDIGVYARVNPEHKLKIIEALRKKGHIIAMTGDGINDAPALKKADIGIAMGITGTEVAKEASNMILTDDNFSSIVNAVEEGRRVYDNVRKSVFYLLSSNMGEILTLFIAIMINLPLPLTAIMILWVNLATDSLPALALSTEPAESDVMERMPRKPNSKIIDFGKIVYMFSVGILMMIGTLILFWRYSPKENLVLAQTVAFSALVMFQMFNVLNSRSYEHSVFSVGMFSNKQIWGAIFVSVLLQVMVIYTPLAAYFDTAALGMMDWVYVVAVSSSVLWYGEIVKFGRKIVSYM